MNENCIKGTITELQCQLFFVSRGYNIYLPLSYDSRCDIIVDIDGILKRIQVKTCHVTENNTGIMFKTHSTSFNKKENSKRPYTKEEVDFFATYYDNQVYLIPIEFCGKFDKTLSFSESPYANVTLLNECLGEIILKQIKEGIQFKKFDSKKRKKVG